MTRRRLALVALSVTAGFLLAASPAVAGGPACNDAFARRVAGSYLMDLTVEGFGALKVLVTLGADCTVSSEDTSDYGVFSAFGGPSFESDNRGAWKRSGWRKVTFNAIGFSYDSDGGLIGINRLSATMSFERGFATFSCEGVHDFFGPADDPLDPDTEPLELIPWTATGQRIPASVD